MDEYPNVRHLRALLAVASAGRISAAADAIHLSQPAVTSAIAKLERGLGVRLFDRTNSGVIPTEIGTIFLRRVESAVGTLQLAARELLRLGRNATSRPARDFDHLITNVQLRALIAVAEAGNFSIAARRVGLSQPSLHRAARELEQLAGVTMFSVTPTGVQLSSGAEALALGARLALAELRQGLAEVSHHLGRDSTHIHIGTMPLARTSILPQAISRMIAAHDGVQVLTVDGPYAELLNHLRLGELDCLVGALRFPAPADDIVQEPLFEDPLSIVVGRQHPLVGRPKLTLSDTLAYPWVAPPKNTPAGTYLFETLRIAYLSATPVRVVSSSLVLLRSLLSLGPFVTILSARQAKYEIDDGTFVVLPVELPPIDRQIGLTVRSNWRPTATQQRFIDLLRAAAAAESS